MADEEEVRLEVEAVQAVYGDDCHVINQFPPHLNLHIVPRTADDSSQQFVEAVLGIQASGQYPQEPPQVDIVDSMGLDEQRQEYLISSVRSKADELASCQMLVALCEEAVEVLSNMNHPDGNCPLCLYPLVPEEGHADFLPFMKLMSCFHCFHSECIVRWWKWLHEQNETESSHLLEATALGQGDLEMQRDTAMLESSELHRFMKRSQGNCPVCRKVFHAEDIVHVLDLIMSSSSYLKLDGNSTNSDDVLLQSEAEKSRREKFEAILKGQQENSGLIEPRRNDVILPGMFLPQPVAPPTTSAQTSKGPEGDDSSCPSGMHLSGSSHQPGTSKRNSSTRRNRGRYMKKHPNLQSGRKQWTKKQNIAKD